MATFTVSLPSGGGLAAHEIEHEVAVQPGGGGWVNVTLMKPSGRKPARTWGYNLSSRRWSYNDAPPEPILSAALQALSIPEQER